MGRSRLQRRLRRINEGPVPPREGLAVACLAAAAAAALPGLGGAAPLPGLVAIALAFAWLRIYRGARPAAATALSHLVVGAFAGACIAAALVDTPATARGWLQLPAARGGPAIVAVLVAALIEDLARSTLRGLARKD